jgi:5-formyltetrahydrofolate cyclo-ligase
VDKAGLRAWIKDERSRLAAEWIAERSRQIAERVLGLPELAQARRVACYLAMPGEVDTRVLLARCWSLGKRVCVPARVRAGGPYAMADVRADSPLRDGTWGIREPLQPEWVRPEDVDLVVAPGVAFDVTGGRVGYGGGHYDRMLHGMMAACGRAPFAVGVAFDFQVLEHVPVGGHDVRMQTVATERRLIRP